MNKQFVAIVGTLLNFTIPGVGSMVGGRVSLGAKQLVLTTVVAVLLFKGVSSFQIAVAAAAAWLWAFTTSVDLLKGAYDN